MFYTKQNIFRAMHSGWKSIDASLIYRAADEGLSLSIYGKNLTDERYIAGIIPVDVAPSAVAGNPSPFSGQTLAGFPNAPRTYGVRLSFNY